MSHLSCRARPVVSDPMTRLGFCFASALALVLSGCADPTGSRAPGVSSMISAPSSATVEQGVSVLPSDGETLIGSAMVPPGQRIFARDGEGTPTSAPLAWLTEVPTAQVRALWEELAQQFPVTGLWPVATTGLAGDLGRPWRSGELSPAGDNEVEVEPDAWFRDHDISENLQVFGPPYRDLAAGSPGPQAWNNTDYIRVSAPGPYASTGLLLVPVERPADVPAVLGWTGPLNHGLGPAQLSAILRSWEDRFGATLVALDFDSLELSVARPPDEDAECAAAAKEHVLTAPDLVAESGLSEYISALCDQDAWFLWWD